MIIIYTVGETTTVQINRVLIVVEINIMIRIISCKIQIHGLAVMWFYILWK